MSGIGGSTSNAARAQRTAPSLGRRNFARVALSALAGREPDEEPNVFETAELWVEPAMPRVNVSFDGEAAIMEAMERRIMHGLGAPDPYAGDDEDPGDVR